MTARPEGPSEAPDVRATYEEFDVDGTTVAMIADPENERAWLQSDLVEDLRR